MEENKTLPNGLEIPNYSTIYRKIKVWVLATLSVALFALTWWLMDGALYGSKSLSFWIWPSMSAVFAISVLSLFAISNHNKFVFAITNTAILASYLLLLPFDLYVVLGGGVFFLLNMFFQKRIKSDETHQTDFSVTRILRGNVIFMVYAVLLLLGFNIYFHTSEDFKSNPERFYDRLGTSAANSVPFISKGLGSVNKDQSLDEFILEQAAEENPEFQNVPEEQKQRALDEFKSQLSEQFSVEAQGGETLSVIIARAATERIKETAKPYEKFFPLIFTLIILALLRTFAFVFTWVIVFVCWVLFKILLALKFFRIEKVPVEVHKLQI